MNRHIRTFLTDTEWLHECKKRLNDALDEPELAMKALLAIETNPRLKREIPKPLFFKVLVSAHQAT